MRPLSMLPPPSSICTAMSRGANSTTCVSSPRSLSALAASRPRRPPPMTTPPLAVGSFYYAPLAGDGDRALGQSQADAESVEEIGFNQGQLLRTFAGEVGSQVHAIVGRPRFFAEHRDVERRCARLQLLQQRLTDHAVTDYYQLHRRSLTAVIRW